jgi:hypothetical protein
VRGILPFLLPARDGRTGQGRLIAEGTGGSARLHSRHAANLGSHSDRW